MKEIVENFAEDIDCKDVKLPTTEDIINYAFEFQDVVDKINIEANQYDLDMLYKEA